MLALARGDADTETVTRMNEAPAVNTAVVSRVDKETAVNGKLVTSGTLEVAGKVEGEIRATTLSLLDGSAVKGEVHADAVTIAGKFEGVLHCKSIALKSSAEVDGEIHYDLVAIENGATIEATFRKKSGDAALKAV